ncbi:MAG: hypothetical protein RML15_07490 [Bacteroidota bacterium]|nr:hypothetical protein [Candidatus Kapabacteria bacterium]MCS7303312.1 hypothetical protein [Candidatus Kapabacteria bacterium]MCX7937662.1 hypothetical protein [Chlorobiota bacterium]MDW8075817.1 hypothetical protein [Bacteroidota bacterium]MDW8272236.1 hypothetical protein [Bacteroidota bacterium]
MATFGIESNGRLENTAIYYNGEQLAGLRQVLLNLGEDGTFDALITYRGDDGELYTKNPFTDYLEHVRTMPPSFTEEEAQSLRLLVIESDGNIENTVVYLNDEPLEGIVHLFVNISVPDAPPPRGFRLFSRRQPVPTDRAEFRAEITFREADGRLTTENIF